SGSTTAVAGADAGAGAIVPHAGNDVSGRVVITARTGSTTGELAEITLGSAYGIAPRVVIPPRDSNAAALDYYVTSTTTTFTIHAASSPTASQSYGFSYHVMQ